ncbi:Rad4-domain-containing protein [Violaceomyces palustris]|uniref:Rad4-domain-containing protein n=1 Tax=Violaceomyces palustris TaxID=1673888 RepID=A0ACD0NX10_9BASI|nr:Rad4-domain-containing protein [Violaceomyces palustris]
MPSKRHRDRPQALPLSKRRKRIEPDRSQGFQSEDDSDRPKAHIIQSHPTPSPSPRHTDEHDQQHDDDDFLDVDPEMEMEMEEVHIDRQSDYQEGQQGEGDEEEHQDSTNAHLYAAAYDSLTTTREHSQDPDHQPLPEATDAPTQPLLPIFKDGKGQPRGVEISVGERTTGQSEKKESERKKAGTLITPRDRQNRINAHKLHVLSLLAFTKIRNAWCNDEKLRDHVQGMIPEYMIAKLKAIHPKKVQEQRERVRMFDSFITELARWWVAKFRLDPNTVSSAALRQPDADIVSGILPTEGRRIDGWRVETASQRDERHRRQRRERARRDKASEREAKAKAKEKGKAKTQVDSEGPSGPLGDEEEEKPVEITLFGPGTSVRPVYLVLLPPAEKISSPEDLLLRAKARSGSRETSAQLFCAMCRSIGVPARLVISPQPLPWSVGASKLANTAPPTNKLDSKLKGTSKLPERPASRHQRRKPIDEFTSDDDEGIIDIASYSPSTPPKRTPASSVLGSSASPSRRRLSSSRAPSAKSSLSRKRAVTNDVITIDSDSEAESILSSRDRGRRTAEIPGTLKDSSEPSSAKSAAGNRSASVGGSDEGNDYRPAKWRKLEAPLPVAHKPRLRAHRPRALKPSEVAGADSDVDPVDLQAPPTMWVEVFSKPFQKWVTVDPVRGIVRATGSRLMEPSPTDRQNKLVYVVAFEEDGYARDVTARYTKTLNSRVARLRPPSRSKTEEDWWQKVVRAMHRPQRLDRDAMEDAELNDNMNREPMPTSVAGFKDHPVYFLEKHLKRDEVVFPKNKVATFQGQPVYSRSNVLSLRSARQWFNEGRVVKEGQQALKWVKTRGYTIANKRAEEQARAEGGETPNEGLYAKFQTELYVAPPVVDGKVPTNAFGNIDLFVPSMLPAGAVHIPHNGSAKVAKKLGIHFAEAITGFEFRKHRSMPRITGIVVAAEFEDTILDAYWASEHAAAEKENTKRQERAIKHWKKLLNSLRIARRIQEQYGTKAGEKAEGSHAEDENEPADGMLQEPGGFVAEEGAVGYGDGDGDDRADAGGREESEPVQTRKNKVLPDRFGTDDGRGKMVVDEEGKVEEPETSLDIDPKAWMGNDPQGWREESTKVVDERDPATNPSRKIVSLVDLAHSEDGGGSQRSKGTRRIRVKPPSRQSQVTIESDPKPNGLRRSQRVRRTIRTEDQGGELDPLDRQDGMQPSSSDGR